MAFSKPIRWATFAACSVLGLAACSAVETWGGASVGAAPDVATGRRLFLSSCAGCHGARGDATGEVADSLFPPPRDLTRGEFRFRSTASGTLPTRADLARTVELGLPGSAMPAWRGLFTDNEIASVVLFVETLSPRFAQEPRRAEDVLLPADLSPVAATPELITRGRDLYVKMGCGECHGAEGRGDGKAASTSRNSDGTVSHVFDFTYGTYKGGASPVDVYRTFVTGLDGAPMPAFDQSLPEESDRWALVAYVRSLGRARGLGFYFSERPTWNEPMADRPAAAHKGPAEPQTPETPGSESAAPRDDGW